MNSRINTIFLQWIDSKQKDFLKAGIVIDGVYTNFQVEKNFSDSIGITINYFNGVEPIDINQTDIYDFATSLDFSTNKFLGRICVWGSEQMDIEILDINMEKTILYDYYELKEEKVDFDNYLSKYIEILQGNKV